MRETVRLKRPLGSADCQDQTGRAAVGALTPGRPRIENPGIVLGVDGEAVAVSINERARRGKVLAQPLMPVPGWRLVAVDDDQPSAGQGVVE